MNDGEVKIALSMDKDRYAKGYTFENPEVKNLLDAVQAEVTSLLYKPFGRRVIAKVCDILVGAERESKLRNLGLTISNPFSLTLLSGERFEIYFKSVTEVREGKTLIIEAGATYKMLEGGSERVYF